MASIREALQALVDSVEGGRAGAAAVQQARAAFEATRSLEGAVEAGFAALRSGEGQAEALQKLLLLLATEQQLALHRHLGDHPVYPL